MRALLHTPAFDRHFIFDIFRLAISPLLSHTPFRRLHATPLMPFSLLLGHVIFSRRQLIIFASDDSATLPAAIDARRLLLRCCCAMRRDGASVAASVLKSAPARDADAMASRFSLSFSAFFFCLDDAFMRPLLRLIFFTPPQLLATLLSFSRHCRFLHYPPISLFLSIHSRHSPMITLSLFFDTFLG